MPNYCYQKLTFSSSISADISEVKNYILNKKGKFDFNKVIPQPVNIFQGDLGAKERRMCTEKGLHNWYDWNIKNWGTKWNALEPKILFDEDWKFGVSFHTAWGIPNPIINNIIETFKDRFDIIFLAAEDRDWETKSLVQVHSI